MKLKKMFGALLLSATLLMTGATVVSANVMDENVTNYSNEIEGRVILIHCPKCDASATYNLIYGDWLHYQTIKHGGHQDVRFKRSKREITSCSNCGFYEDRTSNEYKTVCPNQ